VREKFFVWFGFLFICVLGFVSRLVVVFGYVWVWFVVICCVVAGDLMGFSTLYFALVVVG